jgi:RNA polymerase sigma factor (sigma-70 family)
MPGRPRGARVTELQEGVASAPVVDGDLVEGYLPRIAALARRFHAPGVEVSDLVQEGWLALLEARRRYEPWRGVPFWAYAVPWVHGAIYRQAQDQRRAVRLPAAAQVELGRIRRAGHLLACRDGGEAAPAALARSTGLPADRVERIIAAGRPPRSFNETLRGESEGTALIDLVPDPCGEDAYEDVVSRLGAPDLAHLMDALSVRERDVITRRFGLGRPPQTLADIGRRMGVTRERVRQIEARALGKLRAAADESSAA